MRDLWMDTAIAMKNRMAKIMEEWRDEQGESNMVSIIVMIVIVIAAAGLFRGAIMDAVEKVMKSLSEFVG